MGGSVGSYLDTHTAVWLSANLLTRISKPALDHIRTSELLISPIVLLELQYLFEIKRIRQSAEDVEQKLQGILGVRVCDLNFYTIARSALQESWTREPFDRLIVAHARANGIAPLITADTRIHANYANSIW